MRKQAFFSLFRKRKTAEPKLEEQAKLNDQADPPAGLEQKDQEETN